MLADILAAVFRRVDDAVRYVQDRFPADAATRRDLAAVITPLQQEQAKQRSEMENHMATTQADIDALAAKVNGLKEKLDSSEQAIRSEIENLRGQGVDVTALTAAVDSLSTEVDETAALVPAAPPVEQPTEPSGVDPVVDPATGDAVDESGSTSA